MSKDNIVKATNLIREAEAILATAKAEASREGDDEELGKVRESLEAAQAMTRELERLLAPEGGLPYR